MNRDHMTRSDYQAARAVFVLGRWRMIVTNSTNAGWLLIEGWQ